MRRRSEMKLMELAELVYKMKDDEVIDFAPGDEEEVEYWGGWCGVKKINEFDNNNPMYIVSHYGGEAEAYLYHISEYDHRIGDFVAEEMPVWWQVTDRNRINCCAKMIADYCENWGDGFVPEVFTVDCYTNEEKEIINEKFEVDEWCSKCNREFSAVVIPKNGIRIVCPHCGHIQSPCSLCDIDLIDCADSCFKNVIKSLVEHNKHIAN